MKAAAVALAALLVAASAPARSEMTLEYGVGQDSSPYSFLGGLRRGFHPSAYAFHVIDAGDDHTFEYYIQWNLPAALLGSGVEIGSATAQVAYDFDYSLFGNTSDDIGEIVCHAVLEPWSEATLAWNDRPPIGPAFDTESPITEHGPYACDVTELVQAWIDDPSTHHGIALTSSQPRVLGFNTFDAAVGPELKPSLTLEVVPEPAAAASLAAGCLLLVKLERRRARRLDPNRPMRPRRIR